MKVPEIKNGMTNYNNMIKKFATSEQKKREAMQLVYNPPEADIVQEMLDVFAKDRQDIILRQDEKFIRDLLDPISKLDFHI